MMDTNKMNLPLIILGIACCCLGSYISIIQIQKFLHGKQDKLGFSIKLLGGGVMAIILGIAMIIQNI